jgi:hypothetical protein
MNDLPNHFEENDDQGNQNYQQLAETLAHEKFDFSKLKIELLNLGEENANRVLNNLRNPAVGEFEESIVQNPTVSKPENNFSSEVGKHDLMSPKLKLVSEIVKYSPTKSPTNERHAMLDQSEEVSNKLNDDKFQNHVTLKGGLLSFGTLPEGEPPQQFQNHGRGKQELQSSIVEIEESCESFSRGGSVAQTYVGLIGNIVSVYQELQRHLQSVYSDVRSRKNHTLNSENTQSAFATDGISNVKNAIMNPVAKFMLEVSAIVDSLLAHSHLNEQSLVVSKVENELDHLAADKRFETLDLNHALESFKENLRVNLNDLFAAESLSAENQKTIQECHETRIAGLTDLVQGIQEKFAATMSIVKHNPEKIAPASIDNMSNLEQDFQGEAHDEREEPNELNYSCEFVEEQKLIRLSVPLLKKLSKNFDEGNKKLLTAVKEVMDSREQKLRSSFEHLDSEYIESNAQQLAHAFSEVDEATKDKLRAQVEAIFANFKLQFADDNSDLSNFFDSISNLLKNQIGELFDSLLKMNDLFQVIERLKSNVTLDNPEPLSKHDLHESEDKLSDHLEVFYLRYKDNQCALDEKLTIIQTIVSQETIEKSDWEFLLEVLRDSIDSVIEGTNQLKILGKEKEKLIFRKTNLEKKQNMLFESLERLSDDLKTTKAQLELANQKIASYSQEQNLVEDLQADNESLGRKIVETNEKIEGLTNQLEISERKCADMCLEIQNLINQATDLESRLAKSEAQQKSNTEQAEDQIAGLNQELAIKNGLLENQELYIKEITDHFFSLKNTNTHLENNLRSLETQLEFQRKNSNDLHAKLASLSESNNQTTIEKSRVEKKLADTLSDLEAHSNRNADLITEVSRLQSLLNAEQFPISANKSNFRKSPRDNSSNEKNALTKFDPSPNIQQNSLPDALETSFKMIRQIIITLQKNIPDLKNFSEFEKILKKVEDRMITELRFKIIALAKNAPDIQNDILQDQSISFSDVSRNLNIFSETLSQTPGQILNADGRLEFIKLLTQIYLKCSMASIRLFNDLPAFLLPLKTQNNSHYRDLAAKLKNFTKAIMNDVVLDMNDFAKMINSDAYEFLSRMVGVLGQRRKSFKEFMKKFKEEFAKACQ